VVTGELRARWNPQTDLIVIEPVGGRTIAVDIAEARALVDQLPELLAQHDTAGPGRPEAE
jgi:hypothetical protein